MIAIMPGTRVAFPTLFFVTIAIFIRLITGITAHRNDFWGVDKKFCFDLA
jgi:hypothetical protein